MAETNKTQITRGVQIKDGRGGRRPGAGRKPDYFKRLQVKPLTAAEILARYPEDEAWGYFLEHEDAEIRLKARIYLTDRRDGKPRQAVDVSGGIMHAHTTYRNPLLAALSPEELTVLDTLTRKLALSAPEGPHNQTESNTAIEEVQVESDTTNE